MQERLSNNLKRNGLIQNLIVRELPTGFYEVVNGNHRHKSLVEIGMEKAMVFNLGPISQESAERIAVETNETNFKADNLKLAEVIKRLSDKFGLDDVKVSLPFTDEEHQSMLDALNFDWNQYEKEKKELGLGSGEGTPEEFRTIELRLPVGVADQFDTQLDRFKKALYPDEEPEKVSMVMPLEAMLQHLAQIPDDQLV